MSKKKRTTGVKTSAPDKHRVLQLIEYEITSEPMHDDHYEQLPRHVQDDFDRLYFLAQEQPLKAIPELEQWLEKYPDIPMLYNFLGAAYSRAGKHEQAERTVLENYRRNPDYLFARLNYADICLSRGEFTKVAEILENKFDLKLLYPHRSLFHISEFTAFMRVIGTYFLGIGERKTAEVAYKALRKIDPDSEATRLLKTALDLNRMQKLMQKALTKLESGKRP